MDKKIAVVLGAALIVATSVSAASWTMTPLYTYRMEQASHTMNFLPTEMNKFTYTAEEGYMLNHNAVVCCSSVVPLITGGVNTCDTCDQPTCWSTCPDTCEPTCPNTCMGATCSTCTQPTCETCEETCPYTCSTCSSTCWNTCSGYTCKDTCEIDCWP